MASVKMIQQMSGTRPDGRDWPPPGAILSGISPEEARALCHTSSNQSHPIAIPVVEDRTETADAPASQRTELREMSTRTGGWLQTGPNPAPPAEPEAKPESEARRGPGRPPGTRNKSKPAE